MKITNRGPAETDLSQRIKNDKKVDNTGGAGAAKTSQTDASARVNISSEAREMQKIAELARMGDELRAEKVARIKEQLARGEYSVDAEEVAKSIARSEVSRLLAKE